ncbi:MAG TPA: HNH endonuclease signature motif containing protein, partial [Pseudonocardia sp.]
RIQRAGYPGGIDPLKADLLLGLTDGSLHHLHDHEIVDLFLGRARTEALGDAAPLDDTGALSDAGTRTGTDTAGKPEPRTADRADRAGRADRGDRAGRADHGEGAEGAGQAVSLGRGRAARTGVEIRVGLATLLGLDERCGDIPGLGPVLPGVARGLVADQRHGAQWRFAVTDAEGHLIFAGVTRRRAKRSGPGRDPCQGGVVELHVSAELLGELAAEVATAGAWAPVVADLAAQYAGRHRALARLDACAGSRFASAALARHIQVRDRTCSFPGCRRSSYKADKDHTKAHANGGLTTRCNMGPVCKRHHRYKSLGWWHLSQPSPGQFRWASPLGHLYRTRGDPINPPTTPPCPRPLSPSSTPEQPLNQPGPIVSRRPPASAAVSQPDSDEPPPF